MKIKIFALLIVFTLISPASEAFVGSAVQSLGLFNTLMVVSVVVGTTLAGISNGPKENLGLFVGGISAISVGVMGIVVKAIAHCGTSRPDTEPTP